MERVSTGIKRLDEMIGGYPKGKSLLVIGKAGTGKTVLGLHFLRASLQDGLGCLMVSTEDYRDNIITQAASFGWDVRSKLRSGQFEVRCTLEDASEYHEASLELSLDRTAGEVFEILDDVDGRYGAVLIDNIGAFALGSEPREVREQFTRVLDRLNRSGATPFIICDEGTSREAGDVFVHAVFSAIRLSKRDNPFTNKRERIMDIVKMRSTKVPIDYIRFDIHDAGIVIP